MARKTTGKTTNKARKILALTRYAGDVGVYDLSKPLKVGKEKFSFLVIAKGGSVSGGERTIVWPAEDDSGRMASTAPIHIAKNMSIADALLELGYKLAN